MRGLRSLCAMYTVPVVCIDVSVCVCVYRRCVTFHHFSNYIHVLASLFSFAGDWECYPHDPTVWHVSHFFMLHSNHDDTVTDCFTFIL